MQYFAYMPGGLACSEEWKSSLLGQNQGTAVPPWKERLCLLLMVAELAASCYYQTKVSNSPLPHGSGYGAFMRLLLKPERGGAGGVLNMVTAGGGFIRAKGKMSTAPPNLSLQNALKDRRGSEREVRDMELTNSIRMHPSFPFETCSVHVLFTAAGFFFLCKEKVSPHLHFCKSSCTLKVQEQMENNAR